ncbi:hypothetical protein VNO77_34296 [Canavalia gladiata]|uniref:Uncharacterized protein n=1 Tax=Canavalia gladiata TaxID=3824 RepID=A0AAN9KGG9_CANGL
MKVIKGSREKVFGLTTKKRREKLCTRGSGELLPRKREGVNSNGIGGGTEKKGSKFLEGGLSLSIKKETQEAQETSVVRQDSQISHDYRLSEWPCPWLDLSQVESQPKGRHTIGELVNVHEPMPRGCHVCPLVNG